MPRYAHTAHLNGVETDRHAQMRYRPVFEAVVSRRRRLRRRSSEPRPMPRRIRHAASTPSSSPNTRVHEVRKESKKRCAAKTDDVECRFAFVFDMSRRHFPPFPSALGHACYARLTPRYSPTLNAARCGGAKVPHEAPERCPAAAAAAAFDVITSDVLPTSRPHARLPVSPPRRRRCADAPEPQRQSPRRNIPPSPPCPARFHIHACLFPPLFAVHETEKFSPLPSPDARFHFAFNICRHAAHTPPFHAAHTPRDLRPDIVDAPAAP